MSFPASWAVAGCLLSFSAFSALVVRSKYDFLFFENILFTVKTFNVKRSQIDLVSNHSHHQLLSDIEDVNLGEK